MNNASGNPEASPMFCVFEGLDPAQITDEGTPGVLCAFGFRRFAGG
jgi:hypothetical protein